MSLVGRPQPQPIAIATAPLKPTSRIRSRATATATATATAMATPALARANTDAASVQMLSPAAPPVASYKSKQRTVILPGQYAQGHTPQVSRGGTLSHSSRSIAGHSAPALATAPASTSPPVSASAAIASASSSLPSLLVPSGPSTSVPPSAASTAAAAATVRPSKEYTLPARSKPGRKPMNDEPATKRTAQNRASQRAFRERQQAHVRELEARVAQHDAERARASVELQRIAQRLRADNDRLRANNAVLASRVRAWSARALRVRAWAEGHAASASESACASCGARTERCVLPRDVWGAVIGEGTEQGEEDELATSVGKHVPGTRQVGCKAPAHEQARMRALQQQQHQQPAAPSRFWSKSDQQAPSSSFALPLASVQHRECTFCTAPVSAQHGAAHLCACSMLDDSLMHPSPVLRTMASSANTGAPPSPSPLESALACCGKAGGNACIRTGTSTGSSTGALPAHPPPCSPSSSLFSLTASTVPIAVATAAPTHVLPLPTSEGRNEGDCGFCAGEGNCACRGDGIIDFEQGGAQPTGSSGETQEAEATQWIAQGRSADADGDDAVIQEDTAAARPMPEKGTGTSMPTSLARASGRQQALSGGHGRGAANAASKPKARLWLVQPASSSASASSSLPLLRPLARHSAAKEQGASRPKLWHTYTYAAPQEIRAPKQAACSGDPSNCAACSADPDLATFCAAVSEDPALERGPENVSAEGVRLTESAAPYGRSIVQSATQQGMNCTSTVDLRGESGGGSEGGASVPEAFSQLRAHPNFQQFSGGLELLANVVAGRSLTLANAHVHAALPASQQNRGASGRGSNSNDRKQLGLDALANIRGCSAASPLASSDVTAQHEQWQHLSPASTAPGSLSRSDSSGGNLPSIGDTIGYTNASSSFPPASLSKQAAQDEQRASKRRRLYVNNEAVQNALALLDRGALAADGDKPCPCPWAKS